MNSTVTANTASWFLNWPRIQTESENIFNVFKAPISDRRLTVTACSSLQCSFGLICIVCNSEESSELRRAWCQSHHPSATTLPMLLLFSWRSAPTHLEPNLIWVFLFQTYPRSWISSCLSTTVGAATDLSPSSWDDQTNTSTRSQKTQWMAS